MKMLNIISILSVFAIISNSDAMTRDKSRPMVKVSCVDRINNILSFTKNVNDIKAYQAVFMQGSFEDFLKKPWFRDKNGKKCPILLDDKLKVELENELKNIEKQNTDKPMINKLEKAMNDAYSYYTLNDVESTSFVLHNGKIYIQGNAPI